MPSERRYVVVYQFRSRTAFIYHFSAVSSGGWTDLDDVVGGGNDIFVMLHHHDGVTQVAQLPQHMYQPLCIARMQADGWLVQHIERAYQTAA